MNFEMTAVISAINEAQVISEKLTKRTLVLAFKDGNYDKILAVDFLNANADKLDQYAEGQEVFIKGRADSREYNGKYYHNVTGWYIQSSEASAPAPKQSAPQVVQKQKASTPFVQTPPVNLGDDDLPF